MPKDNSIKSVLIIGSGPIIIGQACEFDYAGSQASLSLKDEGIEVSIINSNPATIMTDNVIADNVYLKPLNVTSLEEILQLHQNSDSLKNIDAVLPTMGGQTALNLAIEAEERGIWEKYGVRIIGVDTAAIEKTENREEFRKLMVEIGIGVAKSKIANSFLEGKEAAQEIGFPLVIRPSYTLGGYGGGFVHKKEDFDAALSHGLQASPTHEVLVEQAVLGWKEYELELLRDNKDNVIIICSIENFDPMGIHTGDSITVAPAMTLPDTVYQRMRDMAINMMNAIGKFAGGCNVQFALQPALTSLGLRCRSSTGLGMLRSVKNVRMRSVAARCLQLHHCLRTGYCDAAIWATVKPPPHSHPPKPLGPTTPASSADQLCDRSGKHG